MNQQSKPIPKKSSEQFLIVPQAAELLQCNPGAIRNKVMRRQIPYRKVAGRLYFLRSELIELVESSPGMTVDEWKKQKNQR